MNLTLLNVAGALSPFVLAATLWGIWKESNRRSIALRMLPPERRPVYGQPQGWRPRSRGEAGDRARSHPLWTLRDCHMELLTEGVMHAFDANATAYVADRVAVNYPPSRARELSALRRTAQPAGSGSTLTRLTLRGAAMVAAGAAAIAPVKPEIEEGPVKTLSYFHSGRPEVDRVQK